jgi:hypothetical protein
MFKLNPAPEFTSEAMLTVYGQPDRSAVQVVWRHKSHTALKAWLESSRTRPTAEFLAEVIADMPALTAEDGTTRPYSAKVLAQLLDDFHAAGEELIEAYIKALQESRRKN